MFAPVQGLFYTNDGEGAENRETSPRPSRATNSNNVNNRNNNTLQSRHEMDRVQRSLFDLSIPSYGTGDNNSNTLISLTGNSIGMIGKTIGMVGNMGSSILGIVSGSNDDTTSPGTESSAVAMNEIDNHVVAGNRDVRRSSQDSDDLEAFRITLPSHSYRVPSLHAYVATSSSSASSSSSSSSSANVTTTAAHSPPRSVSSMSYQAQSSSTAPQQQQQNQQQQLRKHSVPTISSPYAMGMYLSESVPVPALPVVETKRVRQRGFFGYLSWTLVHLLAFIVCFEVGTRMWSLFYTPRMIEADENNTNR